MNDPRPPSPKRHTDMPDTTNTPTSKQLTALAKSIDTTSLWLAANNPHAKIPPELAHRLQQALTQLNATLLELKARTQHQN